MDVTFMARIRFENIRDDRYGHFESRAVYFTWFTFYTHKDTKVNQIIRLINLHLNTMYFKNVLCVPIPDIPEKQEDV